MIFYNYLWKIDDIPEYAGKGSKLRCLSHLNKDSYWARHLKKAIKNHNKVECVINIHNSEEKAFDAEILDIAKYGRRDLGTGTLFNMTSGGEGTSNPSPETLQKMRIPRTAETRKKMSNAKTGVKRTPEACKILSDAKKGISKSIEHCKKMSEAQKGIPRSVEHSKKISDIFKGTQMGKDRSNKAALTNRLNHINKKLKEIHAQEVI